MMSSGGSLFETCRDRIADDEEAHRHNRHNSPRPQPLLSKEAAGDEIEGILEIGGMSGSVHLGDVNEGGVCVQGSTGGGVLRHRDHRQQQRQFEVWDLLREIDFYHLSLTMMLTAVSGLFIAGAYQSFFFW